MQSVSPRIWTRIAVSISYDDNHYTTGARTPTQSGPASSGNKEVLYILQNSRVGVSPSNGLMSYSRHSLWVCGGGYSSAEMQSVYSTVPADWAKCYHNKNVQLRFFLGGAEDFLNDPRYFVWSTNVKNLEAIIV